MKFSLNKVRLMIDSLIDQLPWLVSKRLRQIFPVKQGYYHVLRESPLIILIPEDFNDDIDLWSIFFDALAGVEVVFVCLIRGALESGGEVGFDNTLKDFKQQQLTYPEHRLIYLANNQEQLDGLTKRSLPAILFNQNAIIDERLFTFMPEIQKKYSAIYNALMAPYKRHYLAYDIKDLAVITAVKNSSGEKLLAETKKSLRGASWLNFPNNDVRVDNYQHIPQKDLATHLNLARAGLCLSKLEGAMFASIEYLLCGLPIVSTYSSGGRDAFFEEDYVVLVEDNSSAVKIGLDELLGRCVSGEHIRARTIAKINEHRLSLVKFIQDECTAKGQTVSEQELYDSIFPSQIYSLKKFYSILKYS
jgi:hypothetical protein